MPALYQLSNELASILDNEELSPEDEARLAGVELAFESKVEAVLKYRQGLLADAEALATERSRLKDREEALLRRAEWLKGYVQRSMQEAGMVKVSTLTFGATLAKSPPKVDLVDGAAIPEGFVRTKTTTELDKALVLERYKRGEQLPPGVVVTQGQTLRIS
jgi:hypothetical protein